MGDKKHNKQDEMLGQHKAKNVPSLTMIGHKLSFKSTFSQCEERKMINSQNS